MTRYFIEGGPVFMGILTILFLIILSIAVAGGTLAFNSNHSNTPRVKKLVTYLKSVALFTLVFGILGQIIGLLNIFNYLSGSEVGVASNILAKGIKITFWPVLYGIIIYLFSILLSLGLNLRITSNR